MHFIFFVLPLFASLTSSQIITNGGFDTTTCTQNSCACSSTCTLINPWKVNGTISVVSRSYIKTFTASSTYSIDLCGTSPGGLLQNITTILGYVYNVKFMYSANPLGLTTPLRSMRVYVPGSSALSYSVDVSSFYLQTQNVPWRNGTFSFVATSTITTLKFEASNTGQYGILLDTVEVTQTAVTSGSVTTSPLTSGRITTSPLTTSPLTTSPLTSASVTTSPLTSGRITTSPLTTSPLTTSPLTSGSITTSPVTSNSVTTGISLTSGSVTSNSVTTGALTSSPLTSSPLTSSPLTSSPMTSSSLTSSSGNNNLLTTSPLTTVTITTNYKITSGSDENIGNHSSDLTDDSEDSTNSKKPSQTLAIVFGVLGGLFVLSASLFAIRAIKKHVNFKRKKFYDEKF